MVSTPEDLEFRIHLRNEIMRAGMFDVLDVRILFILNYLMTVQFNNLNNLMYFRI